VLASLIGLLWAGAATTSGTAAAAYMVM